MHRRCIRLLQSRGRQWPVVGSNYSKQWTRDEENAFTSVDPTHSNAKFETPAISRFPDFLPRHKFELPVNFERKDWYPKHMGIQMKVMEGKLRTVDLIVEVHDARVALTGRNPVFASRFFKVRPHILVMNKRDLIDMDRYKEPIEQHYKAKGVEHIVWTNCTERVHSQWRHLGEVMLELLRREHRFNRTVKTEYQVMVVGIPNVGKSSLINALRKNNLGYAEAVKEGMRPGVTVRVQNKVRILDRPLTYILDTPGVLNPWVHDVNAAMKLAACDLILESTTKPYFIADYLLYHMNRHEDFSYVDLLGLEQPTDDIGQLLVQLCKVQNIRNRVSNVVGVDSAWDLEEGAKEFLRLYRRGRFKDQFLDKDLLGFRTSSKNYIARKK